MRISHVHTNIPTWTYTYVSQRKKGGEELTKKGSGSILLGGERVLAQSVIKTVKLK